VVRYLRYLARLPEANAVLYFNRSAKPGEIAGFSHTAGPF